MQRLLKINSSVSEITKRNRARVKELSCCDNQVHNDSKRALRNVSFSPNKVCALLRATAEPKQNQLLRRRLDTDIWKMATRLQYHICHSLSCQPTEIQHREENSGHRLLRIYGG